MFGEKIVDVYRRCQNDNPRRVSSDEDLLLAAHDAMKVEVMTYGGYTFKCKSNW